MLTAVTNEDNVQTKKPKRPEAEISVYCTRKQKREIERAAKAQKPVAMKTSAYVLTTVLERIGREASNG